MDDTHAFKIDSIATIPLGGGIETTPLDTRRFAPNAKLTTAMSEYPKGLDAPLHHRASDIVGRRTRGRSGGQDDPACPIREYLHAGKPDLVRLEYRRFWHGAMVDLQLYVQHPYVLER